MHLLPVLPPQPDETTVSWCARIAHFHAGMSCVDWLKVMQISRTHVMDTTSFCIERLSTLTGVSEAVIQNSNVKRVADRELRYRNEHFGAGFTTRTHTTYCPACLLDDAVSAPNGHRIGRLSWVFAPVRVCPHHNVELVRRKSQRYYERFQDMNMVAPCDRELRVQISKRAHKEVSPLQSYVTDRLAGKGLFVAETQSDWLDGQQIDQAARACELLGVCRIFGAHTDLEMLSLAQWDEAGAAGFEAAGNGPTGIRRALQEIAELSLRKKGAGGPQAAFGRLYQWMQNNKCKRDPGPIKDAVREYILDTMPVDPGTSLFGTLVTERRRHSALSLSKSAGIHPKTMKRALVGAGLLPEDNDALNERVTFDVEAGEKLAQRIHNSIPITKVPAYLNCNRMQAEMLVKNGIFPQLVRRHGPGLGRYGGVLANVATDDLDNFLSRFRMRGQPVRFAGDKMLDVIAASVIARQTVTDIVRFVLEGRLVRVETLTEDLRFRSVLVDPEEIKVVARKIEEKIGYSAQDVGKRLGMSSTGPSSLRKALDHDGKPFLPAIEIINARGTVRYRFAENAITRFEQAHVTLTELSKERGLSSKAVSQCLKEAGIEPIMRRALLNVAVYRRADL